MQPHDAPLPSRVRSLGHAARMQKDVPLELIDPMELIDPLQLIDRWN